MPERQSNRRMIPADEHVSVIYPKWNAVLYFSFSLWWNGLSRIQIPTDQLLVLSPLSLQHKATTSFSNTLKEASYVSPYMRIMKDVIDELKISETNQPVKKVVIHAVMECAAKRNIPVSNRTAEYLAQAIRLPDAQIGGGGCGQLLK